jgi:hypothetical protein
VKGIRLVGRFGFSGGGLTLAVGLVQALNPEPTPPAQKDSRNYGRNRGPPDDGWPRTALCPTESEADGKSDETTENHD